MRALLGGRSRKCGAHDSGVRCFVRQSALDSHPFVPSGCRRRRTLCFSRQWGTQSWAQRSRWLA